MESSNQTRTHTLKRFARQLLATTCLTVAIGAVAEASTTNETSVVDFSNTFLGRNILPIGTTEVIGQINPSSDIDYFQIGGLLGGGAYNFTGVYTDFSSYGVLNSSGGILNFLSSNPSSMAGVIPSDGILVVQVQQAEQLAGYDLTLTAPTIPTNVPEPSSLSSVGIGLIGALALRRKLKK
jgi:hypothetical protein